MAKIDELVLKMKFDNSRFKSAAQETLGILGNLKSRMNLDGLKNPFRASTQGASELGRAVQNVDMSRLNGDVNNISRSLSAMGVIGRTALGKLTVDAINVGKKITSAVMGPLVEGGRNRALNIQQARFTLQGLKADVEAIEKAAMNAVDGTAYGFDEAAKAASQFYASGLTSAKEQERALLAISGVAAMTSSEYGDIARIFTTIAGNGRVMASELNSFASRGLNVAAELAKARGISEGALRDLVSEGKISFNEFYDVMNNAFGEHAKKAGETYVGALANAKAPLARIGADIADVYLTSMIKVYNAIKPFLDTIHGAIKPIIEFINTAQRATLGGFADMLNGLTEGLSKNGDKGWIGNFADGFYNIIVQIDRFKGAIRDAGVRAFGFEFEGVRATVDRVSAAFLKFAQSIQFSDRFLSDVTEIFGALFSVIRYGLGYVKMFVTSVLAVADAIARYILPHIISVIAYVAKAFSWVLRWVLGLNTVETAFGALTWVIVGIIKIIGKFIGLIIKATDAVFGFFKSIAKKLLGGTFLDPDIYPEKQAQGLIEKIKAMGRAIASLPTKGLNVIVNAFRLLRKIVDETWLTLKEFVRSIDFSGVSRIFDWIKNLKVFDGIKNPFEKLSQFRFDFSGAIKSVESFGASVRAGIGGKAGVNAKLFDPIKNGFRSLVNYLRSVDWGGIMSNIGSSISNGAKFVWGAITNTFSKVKDVVSNVEWRDLGSTIIEKISDGISRAADLGHKIFTAIKDAISNAVEKINFGDIWDNIKDFGKKAKDATVDFKDGIKDAISGETVEVDVQVVKKGNVDIGTPVKKPVEEAKSYLKSFSEFIQGILGKGGSYDALKATLGQGVGGFLADVADAIGRITSAFSDFGSFLTSPISSFFKSAEKTISGGFTSLGGAVVEGTTQFGGAISDYFSTNDIHKWVNTVTKAINTVSIYRGVNSLVELTDAVKSIPEGVGGILEAVKGRIESLTAIAERASKGNFIMKLAVSIAIMAGSLYLLSRLSWEEIFRGLTAMTVGMGLIGGAMFALSKIPTVGVAAAQIFALAVAVGVLALALQMLKNVGWGDLASGLGKLALTLGTLAGILWLIPEKTVAGNAKAMIALAFSVLMFYFAIKLMNKLPITEVLSGMLNIGLVIAGLALSMRLVPEGSLLKFSTSLLIYAGSLWVLGLAMAKLASMDFVSLAKGMLTVAITMGILVGSMVALSKFGGKVEIAAMTILSFAGAIYIFSLALRNLAGYTFAELGVGVIAIVILVATLTVSLRSMKDLEIKEVSVKLMAMATTIAVIALAIAGLAQLDQGKLFTSTLILGILMLAMAGLSAVMGGTGKISSAGASTLLAMAGAVAVMAGALSLLSGIDPKALGVGLIALAVGFGIFLGAAAIAQFVGLGILFLVGGLAALALGAIGIAYAVSIISRAFERFVNSLGDLSTALDELVPALETFQERGVDAIKDIATAFDFGDLKSLYDLAWALGSLRDAIGAKDGWFTDKEGLGSALSQLSEGVKTLSEVEITPEKVQDIGNALHQLSFVSEQMAKVRDSIGGTNGWFRDKDSLGSGLRDIGEGLKAFSGLDVTLTDVFSNLRNVDIEALTDIASTIQEVGNTNFKVVLDQLKQAFEDFGSAFGGRVDENSFLWGLWSKKNNQSSLGEEMTKFAEGTRTLSEAATNLSALNEHDFSGVANFRQSLDSLRDAGIVEIVDTIMPPLQNLKEVLGTGEDGFPATMARFGQSLQDFSVNSETIGNVVSLFKELSDASQYVEGIEKLKSALSSNKGVFGNEKTQGLGDSMKNLASSLEAFRGIGPEISSAFDALSNLDLSAIDGIKTAIQNAFSEDLGQNIKARVNDLKEGTNGLVNAFSEARQALEEKIPDMESTAGRLMEGFVNGMNLKKSDVKAKAKEIASAAVEGVRGVRPEFVNAGRDLAAGLAEGISAGMDGVTAAARNVARAAVSAAKSELKVKSPSRVFKEIGRFVTEGLAVGIIGTASVAEDASRFLAASTIASAENELEINSPSKKFFGIGSNVTEGLAQGIDRNSNGPLESLQNLWTNIAQINKDGLEQTNEINKDMLREFGLTLDQISPYHRIQRLTDHANARYATELKQKKIKDAEEKERAEDEREKVYQDIKDSERAIEDAKRELDEINNPTEAKDVEKEASEANKDAKTAEKEAREAARRREDAEKRLRDAEKSRTRALSRKERYEYEQSGTEAGVAFKDGVAEGLIEEDDTPKYHEILTETLYEDFEKVRQKASDFLGVLEAIRKMGNTFKQMGTQVNNLRRAFTRTSNSKDVRSFARNLWDSFEGASELTESMFSFLDIFEKFRPYVSMFLGLMTALPQIMQGISGITGALGSSVGMFGSLLSSVGGSFLGPIGGVLGGIGPMFGSSIQAAAQAAIPIAITAIIGFIAAVVAAIVATYVVWDSGGEQMVLRLAKSITEGIAKMSQNLPYLLRDFALQMIRGITNLMVEVPRMIANMMKGFMQGLIGFVKAIPESIPIFIRALIDAFITVITENPAIFIDLALTIVHALLEAFFNTIPEFILNLPEWFKTIGKAIVDGIVQGFTAAWESFKENTMNHLYNLGNVFIKFANFFRKLLGQELYPLLGKMPTPDGQAIFDWERRIQNSTRNGYINAFENSDYHPTLRPEIDMDYVNAQLADANLNSEFSLRAARNAGAGRLSLADKKQLAPVTNINYVQNNTSPKPLSTIEIYRNTQRQLDNMR